MEYVRHGAACCGISHVHTFDGATLDDFDRVLRLHDNGRDHGAPGNRLLEAVLTDRQLNPSPSQLQQIHFSVRDAGGWAVILATRGFVLQTRFRNSNTGRYCNVFHRVMTREDIRPASLAFNVDAVPAVPTQPLPVPPAPPPIVLPENWIENRDTLLEFHTGEPLHIVRVQENYVVVSFINGGLPAILPDGYQIERGTNWAFYFQDGSYIGCGAATRGAIRMARRQEDAAPAEEDVQEPGTVWSTEFLSHETAREGLRVRYVHREGIGTSPRFHNWEGVVERVRDGNVLVRFDTEGRSREFSYNRFVYETGPMPQQVLDEAVLVPAAEPVAVPDPVVETRTEFFALRRTGDRAGPFETEEQARQRWPRVRSYVRIDTATIDGVIEESTETVIAA